jgi:hypothetical protein
MRHYLIEATDAILNYDEANSTQTASEFYAGIDEIDGLYRNKLIEVTIAMFSQISNLVQNYSPDEVYQAMVSEGETQYPLNCIGNLYDVHRIANVSSVYLSALVNSTKNSH